jgi:long-subunit fatty acid transport protein
MLSACASQFDCAPEDPSFDSLTELDATSGFTPSGIVGLTVAYPKVRGGFSFQLPFFVRADGDVRSRLPTNPMFDGSVINGSSVSLAFDLPLMARLGVEYRPIPPVRVELGLDYESWSMQDRLTIHPHGIHIDNVPGLGTYYLKTMYEQRNLNDSVSVHIGGEWEAVKNRLVVRAGYLIETSATPDSSASVLVPDGLHNMLSLGVGVKLGKVRLDLGYAHIFTLDRTVDHCASRSLQIDPIQPGTGLYPCGPKDAIPVGGGTYHISDDLLALGLDARF